MCLAVNITLLWIFVSVMVIAVQTFVQLVFILCFIGKRQLFPASEINI